MRRMLYTFFLQPVLLFCFCAAPGSAVDAKTIYVSPSGNDAWSGEEKTSDETKGKGPVATLNRARDIIRSLKKRGALTESVKVMVSGGAFRITEPFVLTWEDSGTKDFPISYEAAPGLRPVITGGRRIQGFVKEKNGIWKTEIPQVADGSWWFEQLFVNGKRAVRARTPNRFYYYMKDTTEAPVPGKKGLYRRTTVVRPRALALMKKPSSAELKDVTLVAHHKWCISRRFLTDVDHDTKSIITVGEKLKSYSGWPVNTRFYLENFKAALDKPGEWFLSRSGTLFYKPLPGEDMTKARVEAPVADKLVVFKGEPEKNRFVEHVSLKGLRFTCNRYPLPRSGYAPFQAAFVTEAAVMADGARNIAITDCDITHTADYAVWFRRGCKQCLLSRCHLFDMGSGGVRIGEGGIRPIQAERTSHITCDNNIINQGGRTYTSAVGVWIGQSGDNTVTHNDISDFFYTGISAGWRWGYADGLAKRNTITFNHVHHLGQGILSDMGGIYTLGPSEGTVVGNNIFHDIYAYSYGGWGLYTDEGSTGITMENNLVYKTKTGSFHQHYGKDNIIRNNILAFSRLHQVQASRVESHRSFVFERNIVIWKTGPLLAGPWDRVKITMDNNCYYQIDGKPVTFIGKDLKAWQSMGYDRHSIIEDPGFVDAAQNDFSLKPDAAALKIGFKPFDYTKAGVYGGPAWIKKAKEVELPEFQEIPGPPPMSCNDTFETTPLGSTPRGATSFVEKSGDGIAVTEEQAAGGKRSLKVTDAAGLKHGFNPHFYFSPDHKQGVTVCSFDLRIEADSRLNCEFRDWRSSPYAVAVRFAVDKGTLHVHGKTPLELFVEKWIHFEIRCPVGKGNKGTWDLSVRLPGGEVRGFKNIKNATGNFEHLTWLGFTSEATWETHFYLDNFVLDNK